MKRWVWIGAGIIICLALYLSGAVEVFLLALLGVGVAGAREITGRRKETDKTVDEMKETSKRYDGLKEDYRKEVEKIEKEVVSAPIGDLLAHANQRERKRRNKTKS